MIGLIGSNALLVALALAIAGAMMAVIGVRRDRPALVRGAYAAAYTNFALLGVAVIAMLFALVAHDFSVSYVAQVGSRSTPLFFTVISLWSALEGSILFWGFVLAMYTALVVYLNRNQPGKTTPYATATLLVVSVFFLILLIGPANPFRVMSPVPDDGPGPNPLLQNHPLMAVHPPFLYLGYVGFAVPFAFAVGAMLAGELKSDFWIRSTRQWTIASWMFLTVAIVAGMWWSYEVLGWGGYWAWDPVENASFMPWLSATAFLHSVVVQKRRKMLRLWNLNLVAATFVLTILGTFLTRSGVLSSVHAFTQGTIGYYFLTFIAIVLVVTMALVAGNSSELRAKGKLDSVASRESVFLLNNLLLSAFTFTVLLGTLFPLVAEAVRGVKVSVGAPFFNKMTLPLGVALVFLMGVGPALPWRRASREQVRAQLAPPTIAGVLVALLAVILGARDGFAILAYLFGAFALTANLRELWEGTRVRRRAHGEAIPVALVRLIGANRHRYGGYLAHLGVVAAVVGIAASSGSKVEREATLKPGDRMNVGPYVLELRQLWQQEQPHRFSIGADVAVYRGGKQVGVVTPRQNFYATQEQPVPTPSVRTTPASDVYANLMAFKSDGSDATLRVLIEPLVVWIWIGGGIVCLGALISLWPRRREIAAVVHPVRVTEPEVLVPELALSGASAQVVAEVTS